MNELSIINQDGVRYIDSREVAEVIGKDHFHLLRDIRGYIKTMGKVSQSNFGVVDFFLENSYLDAKGEIRPCYLISKMGAEVIANKLTGDKGVLFTVAYVTKFNEMENAERAALEALAAMPHPRLGEINACVRIVVRGLKNFGATPQRIMEFLKETYEPLGISVNTDDLGDGDIMPWYSATEIAVECGIYSLSGRPHAQAVSCILNENVFIGAEHKRVETADYGDHIGVSVRYDKYALRDTLQWIVDNELPEEVYGFERTFHVQYKD
jgi:Rha family phage regulatory protein